MGDPTPKDSLDALKTRAEQDPTDFSLRFDLGARLLRFGNHKEAILHLQAATRSPRLRQAVLDLLRKTFGGDDPPEDELPPDAGVPAPLKPSSPSSDSAAKKLPPGDTKSA